MEPVVDVNVNTHPRMHEGITLIVSRLPTFAAIPEAYKWSGVAFCLHSKLNRWLGV